MSELTKYDLAQCVRRLPKVLGERMREDPMLIMVAGWYIRSVIAGEPVNDVDVMIPTAERAGDLAKLIANGVKVFKSHNAYTIHTRPCIQIITRWTFTNPESVIDSFDFTIAKASIWFDKDTETWKSVCHPDFYADLAAKRLIYTSPVRIEEAGGSLLRVLKFYQRGYRIPLKSFGEVIARLIMAIKFEEIEEGDTREKRIAQVTTSLLRLVDPNTDPDKWFFVPTEEDQQDEEKEVTNPVNPQEFAPSNT